MSQGSSITEESQKDVRDFYIKCKSRDLLSMHVKVHRSTKIPQTPHKSSANVHSVAIKTCGDAINE